MTPVSSLPEESCEDHLVDHEEYIEREATELANYDRVTNGSNGDMSSCVPGANAEIVPADRQPGGLNLSLPWNILKKFWHRQISTTVTHVNCRDHFGTQKGFSSCGHGLNCSTFSQSYCQCCLQSSQRTTCDCATCVLSIAANEIIIYLLTSPRTNFSWISKNFFDPFDGCRHHCSTL